MREFNMTDPGDWPDSLADVRDQMGEPLNVHRFLANYPGWLRNWWPFRNQVIHESSLSKLQYELIVLRVATLCEAPYEWEHHVVTGREQGLGDSDFAALRQGPSATHWNDAESCLLSAVDNCLVEHCIAPDTLSSLSAHYSDNQILDLVATVTMYQAMAIVTRSFDIAIDEDKPSFAAETFKPG